MICGAEAGEVTLVPADAPGPDLGGPPGIEQLHAGRPRLLYATFTGIVEQSVDEEQEAKLIKAIHASDPGALYRLDAEAVPFYCPKCEESYCREHWQLDAVLDDMPGQIDYITGTCTARHERIIEDRPMGFPMV